MTVGALDMLIGQASRGIAFVVMTVTDLFHIKSYRRARGNKPPRENVDHSLV